MYDPMCTWLHPHITLQTGTPRLVIMASLVCEYFSTALYLLLSYARQVLWEDGSVQLGFFAILVLQQIHSPVDQMLQVQSRAVDGVVRVAFGSDAGEIPIIDIRVSLVGTNGLVLAEDLWEDAYAFEVAVLLFAHLAESVINWLVKDVNGEIFQYLGSTAVGESIRVGASVSGGEEHDSSMIIVGRHIRYVTIVCTMLSWRDVGIVSHYEPPVVSFDGGGCTVSKPHQVPPVTIG